MVGRVKFEVWNAQKKYWADALCKEETLSHNIKAFILYGFTVQAKGLRYSMQLAAQEDAA